ncbi:MAG: radical SAM protein [Bacteroidales bacterium]|nr:radical SAM protein [Bacteroidales bacterium]MBO7617422.1 radical SAM protein [Bacteroidales bacterium]
MNTSKNEYRAFYKVVGGNEGNKCNYTARLDTYGCGCSHDCKYCYAKSLLDFRKLWHPENPSVANIKKVIAKIKKLPKDQIVRLGGMTDCFQPIEREYGVTYKTIQALNEQGIGYLIVTKSSMVACDAYRDILRKDLAHIQITVTCTDDYFNSTYEKATPPSRRIAAIERLQKEGFDVTLRLSPFVPQFIDKGVLDIDIINSVQCDKILVEFLRVNSWIKKWFDIDYSDYTVKQSGYLHLPLEKKLQCIGLIKGFKEITVCEDETEAYNYWRNNFNPNPKDCCNLRLPNR